MKQLLDPDVLKETIKAGLILLVAVITISYMIFNRVEIHQKLFHPDQTIEQR